MKWNQRYYLIRMAQIATNTARRQHRAPKRGQTRPVERQTTPVPHWIPWLTVPQSTPSSRGRAIPGSPWISKITSQHTMSSLDMLIHIHLEVKLCLNFKKKLIFCRNVGFLITKFCSFNEERPFFCPICGFELKILQFLVKILLDKVKNCQFLSQFLLQVNFMSKF